MTASSVPHKTKRCSRCKKRKPRSNFHQQLARRDGLTDCCKKCKSAYNKQYRLTEKGRQAEARRVAIKKTARHAKGSALTRPDRLWAKFRVTVEEYDALVLKQGGICAICLQKPPEGQCLNLDHNHLTGNVRGLLCTLCNTALGKFKDDPERLARAEQYLLNNECLIPFRPRIPGERRPSLRKTREDLLATNAAKTHCKHGHLLPPPDELGRRVCLECVALWESHRKHDQTQYSKERYTAIKSDPEKYAARLALNRVSCRNNYLKRKERPAQDALPAD